MVAQNEIPQGFKAVDVPKGFKPVKKIERFDPDRSIQEQQLEARGITREQAIEQGLLEEERPRQFRPLPEAGTPFEALRAGFEKGFKGVGLGALQLGAQVAEQFGAENQAFQDRLAEIAQTERERVEAISAEAPLSGASGEILGTITAAPAPAVRTLKGAVGLGAGFGAVQPTETTDPEERIENAVVGSLFGLGSAAAVRFFQKIPTAISDFISDSKALTNSPSIEQLRAKATRLYAQAEADGVGFGAKKFEKFAKKLRSDMTSAGAKPRLADKAVAVLDEFDALIGTNPTFKEMDELRKISQIAASSADRAERRLGVMIINKLDGFVETGNAQVGTTAKEARALWSKLRRDEAISQVMAKAENSPSGFEQGLRVGFRQLLNDPKKLRGFSAVQKKAMEEIVRGTATQNILRSIGKLGFDIGRATPNVVGGGGGAIASGVAGGLPAIAAQQTASIGARRGSEALARRKANVLRALARSDKTELEITRLENMLNLAGDDDLMFNAIVRAAGIGAVNER